MKEDALLTQKLLNDQAHSQRRWSALFGGSWRTTVWLGALLTTLILLVNTILLIWTGRTSEILDGVATVFEGSCDRTRNIAVSTHLLINIFSTILLGASNNCAQLLCAPTRNDLTKAHAQGRWLDIGVPSIRNLRSITYWRSFLWAILMISSLPLHLLYNSVIFETSSTHLYQATIVTEAFLDGGWWNETQVGDKSVPSIYYPGESYVYLNTYYSGSDYDSGFLHDFQDNVGGLEKLNNTECIQQFGSGDINPTRGNVIAVTSYINNDTVIWSYGQDVSDSLWSGREWICASDKPDYSYLVEVPKADGTSQTQRQCNTTTLLRDASTWTLAATLRNSTHDLPIRHCLTKPASPHCTIRISTTILTIIIVCNILKVFCLILTACGTFRPLATVGDAIASFLDVHDYGTEAKGPIAILDIKRIRHSMLGSDFPAAQDYKARRPRWKDSVSIVRWYSCVTLCLLAISATVLFLVLGVHSSTYTAAQLFANFGGGLSAVMSNSMVHLTTGLSLMVNVLITNLPQLIISCIYYVFNSALTSMLLAHEYAAFATRPRTLRVSRPTGQQRSTHRLQLPYKYIVPLMLAMTILHWLISRSIFLVQLVVYGHDDTIKEIYTPGNNDYQQAISGCGYAILPMLLAATLGTAMVAALLCLSRRKLAPGIPLAESCSLAISAACANTLETDAATKRVQYGVLQRPPNEDGLQYVGFSAQEVKPLQDGVKYL